MKRIAVDIFPHVSGRKIPYCRDCLSLLVDKGATCGNGTCSGGVNEFVYLSLIQHLKLKLAVEHSCIYTCVYSKPLPTIQLYYMCVCLCSCTCIHSDTIARNTSEEKCCTTLVPAFMCMVD